MGRDERRKNERNQKRQKKLMDEENPTMVFEIPPAVLSNYGLIITTQLSIAESHAKFLAQNNMPIPPPVTCRFLVDTGATRSLVKHEFAEKAGLKLISENTPIRGVGVDTTGKTYIGRILFIANSQKVKSASYQIAVDAQINSGALQDIKILDGLIGRDVLQHFELRINGKTGRVTMTFLKS